MAVSQKVKESRIGPKTVNIPISSTKLLDNNVSTILQLPIKNTPDNFVSGKISKYLSAWIDITSDKWVLDIVRNGYDIEFASVSEKNFSKKQIVFNKQETEIISQKIEKGIVRKYINMKLNLCQPFFFGRHGMEAID